MSAGTEDEINHWRKFVVHLSHYPDWERENPMDLVPYAPEWQRREMLAKVRTFCHFPRIDECPSWH